MSKIPKRMAVNWELARACKNGHKAAFLVAYVEHLQKRSKDGWARVELADLYEATGLTAMEVRSLRRQLESDDVLLTRNSGVKGVLWQITPEFAENRELLKQQDSEAPSIVKTTRLELLKQQDSSRVLLKQQDSEQELLKQQDSKNPALIVYADAGTGAEEAEASLDRDILKGNFKDNSKLILTTTTEKKNGTSVPAVVGATKTIKPFPRTELQEQRLLKKDVYAAEFEQFWEAWKVMRKGLMQYSKRSDESFQRVVKNPCSLNKGNTMQSYCAIRAEFPEQTSLDLFVTAVGAWVAELIRTCDKMSRGADNTRLPIWSKRLDNWLLPKDPEAGHGKRDIDLALANLQEYAERAAEIVEEKLEGDKEHLEMKASFVADAWNNFADDEVSKYCDSVPHLFRRLAKEWAKFSNRHFEMTGEHLDIDATCKVTPEMFVLEQKRVLHCIKSSGGLNGSGLSGARGIPMYEAFQKLNEAGQQMRNASLQRLAN